MSKPNEERDIYYIPPNFLASGRLFGGMIRARNAIEACVLVLLTGIPIIKLPMSLTVRIIILCLLPLPLGILALSVLRAIHFRNLRSIGFAGSFTGGTFIALMSLYLKPLGNRKRGYGSKKLPSRPNS